MPEMRGEKIRTADYRFSGKNLKKKLIIKTKVEVKVKAELIRLECEP